MKMRTKLMSEHPLLSGEEKNRIVQLVRRCGFVHPKANLVHNP